MIKNNTGFGFGELTIGLLILFAAFILFFRKKVFSIKRVKHYQLIDEELNIKQDYQKNINIGSIIGGTKTRFTENGEGHGLSVYFDIYLENAQGHKGWTSQYDKHKPILRIGNSPHIYVNHKTGMLVVMLQYKDNPYYSHYPQIEVELPHQKWTKVLVVIDGRYVNIYYDDKLIKSAKLGNVPYLHLTDDSVVVIGEQDNNMQGKIRDLRLYYSPAHLEDL